MWLGSGTEVGRTNGAEVQNAVTISIWREAEAETRVSEFWR